MAPGTCLHVGFKQLKFSSRAHSSDVCVCVGRVPKKNPLVCKSQCERVKGQLFVMEPSVFLNVMSVWEHCAQRLAGRRAWSNAVLCLKCVKVQLPPASSSHLGAIKWSCGVILKLVHMSFISAESSRRRSLLANGVCFYRMEVENIDYTTFWIFHRTSVTLHTCFDLHHNVVGIELCHKTRTLCKYVSLDSIYLFIVNI